MSKAEIFKRYLIFTVGLFISSFGVAVITKADLGTSPISAIPYVLSLYYPLTLGEFTIIFSVLLIVIQLIILRKNFKAEYFLQLPVSIAFGYFIDFSMFLLKMLSPDMYVVKLLFLLAGCLILGIGVYMEVLANVVMLPGESFVRAIVMTLKKEFGTMKITFDVTMTLAAAALSFVFMSHLAGVREGTVIAALLVGAIARFIGKHLDFLPEKLFASVSRAEDLVEELIHEDAEEIKNENVRYGIRAEEAYGD